MIAHPVAHIIFWSIALYLLGMWQAYRKNIIAKHSLPLIVKRILFPWLANKFTLITIIIQTLVVSASLLALIVCFFIPSAIQEIAGNHGFIMIVLLFVIGFSSIKIGIIEDR